MAFLLGTLAMKPWAVRVRKHKVCGLEPLGSLIQSLSPPMVLAPMVCIGSVNKEKNSISENMKWSFFERSRIWELGDPDYIHMM